MAKPRQLPPFDGVEEMLLGAGESLDFAPDKGICFVVQVGNAEKFPQALHLKCLDASFCFCQKCPRLASVEQDREHQRSVEPELGLEADVALPYPVKSGHCCCCCGDPYADFCSAGAAPKYLKLATSFSVSPLMVILALMLLVLFTMVMDFSVLTSIPYALALLSSLSVRACSSVLLPPIRSMSSAKRRLQIGLPPIEMEVW